MITNRTMNNKALKKDKTIMIDIKKELIIRKKFNRIDRACLIKLMKKTIIFNV